MVLIRGSSIAVDFDSQHANTLVCNNIQDRVAIHSYPSVHVAAIHSA